MTTSINDTTVVLIGSTVLNHLLYVMILAGFLLAVGLRLGWVMGCSAWNTVRELAQEFRHRRNVAAWEAGPESAALRQLADAYEQEANGYQQWRARQTSIQPSVNTPQAGIEQGVIE